MAIRGAVVHYARAATHLEQELNAGTVASIFSNSDTGVLRTLFCVRVTWYRFTGVQQCSEKRSYEYRYVICNGHTIEYLAHSKLGSRIPKRTLICLRLYSQLPLITSHCLVVEELSTLFGFLYRVSTSVPVKRYDIVWYLVVIKKT